MRCSNCNNEIADNSNSCIFCATTSSSFLEDGGEEGITIENAPPRLGSTKVSKGATIILSFISGVLLAGLALGVYWLLNDGEGQGLSKMSAEVLEPTKPNKEADLPALPPPQPNPNAHFTPAPKEIVVVSEEKPAQSNESFREGSTPTLIVIPTKMSLFYRGVDNPISISVPGYSDEDIDPSATNGTLTKSSAGYIMRPGKDTEVLIGATVTNPDGSKKSMPGMKFRVRNTPNPTPYFAGKSAYDATILKSDLEAAVGVVAKMEDFDFDPKFEIIEFRVTMIVGGTPIENLILGPEVSSDLKQMLAKAKPGQKIYIEGIKALGPDGSVRSLGALSFKVM